ncbi:DUF1015 family protein [Nocardioides nanhaiensis]|uniref:DUF1015 domain-containing protein n=1 Tax=Nocardioides nanhaiensis TaxID=1476871 RepID=A0ABP8WPA6_9ACTN
MDSGSVVTPPYTAGPLTLEPFRALTLAPHRIGDPASARTFARPYREVPARLARWEAQRQLRREPEPAVYLHEYTAGGITVRGLVGLVDLTRRAGRLEERAIFPHEGIYPDQADDLAARLELMRINPAPILLVHRAEDDLRSLVQQVAAGRPAHRYRDRGGQQHRVWTVTDPGTLAALRSGLATARALIADGHHRYAAYLRLQQRDPGGPCDRGLAMLVDHGDTPLFLGAIHRVLSGSSLDDVETAARSLGLPVTVLAEQQAIAALAPRRLVATDTDRWMVLGLPDDDAAAVEVLHHRLVPALPHGPRRTTYHHSVTQALAHTGPDLGTAVLLPAPDVDHVLRIVAEDRLLPEKATSFQPKPSLGTFIRPWDDG